MKQNILIGCALLATLCVRSHAADANPHIGSGLKRLLYVADDQAGEIKLYDIDRRHEFVRALKIPATRVRGLSAHAATGRLFFSDDPSNSVGAYDFIHEKIIWQVNVNKFGGKFPDRLNVTLDGRALYVPCKQSDKQLVLDAATGARLAEFAMTRDPHNTFIGEQGRYVYCSARSGGPLYLADPLTHQVVKTIGPFSGPIRPFSVNESETLFFANITKLSGFGVGDIATGKVVCEVTHEVPAERRAHPSAATPLPHGDQPLSHGLAVRPGSKEVWFLDDAWGYLYVFDITTMPPRHLADVPLFDDIAQTVGPAHNRWVSFSIDGKYCYTPTRIIDADARKVVGNLADSEKLVEIDFQDGVPVRVSGQNGGVYPAVPANK